MKTRVLFYLAAFFVAAPCGWSADDKSAPAAKQAVRIKRVDVEEFDKLRSDKSNVVLDVRTEREFKAGHIPGATNIDVNAADFEEKVAKLDKNKTYLVHCAAGSRSARACKKLEGMGFTELYDLAPGFSGWQKAGKAVEK